MWLRYISECIVDLQQEEKRKKARKKLQRTLLESVQRSGSDVPRVEVLLHKRGSRWYRDKIHFFPGPGARCALHTGVDVAPPPTLPPPQRDTSSSSQSQSQSSLLLLLLLGFRHFRISCSQHAVVCLTTATVFFFFLRTIFGQEI